ncbi:MULTISPECIES: type 4a pilus biogenesis protein PilO [Corallincola]|uniref:Pilus assembly protein PilP n=3 Tax=Corallincola TaxID=1775176 RepID=A0A368N4H4_9GAMM|nr:MULTISPECIES: type 4a pilus biogenesis protein PilO [Corallincola]RCU45080.1 pilus assembly protein PilP [Corallincola holothuriorum]TAA46871.1 pilus assembly protein PilP [Corallincola spongiicola]TCI04519.1 pilus assembly protein PilP [Corallincola luteus]
MKFDLKELNEIDFNELDLNNMGEWPSTVKAIFIGIVGVLTCFLFYYFMIGDQLDDLSREQAREIELREQFRSKYHLAARVKTYREQMKAMEETFENLLRILPLSHETPGLLDDITYVGTTHGLEFVNINWEPERPQEFYIELPIAIVVEGDYHQFGDFVSDVSALPRIVSLHDFSIKRIDESKLQLSILAKTYRYKEAQ